MSDIFIPHSRPIGMGRYIVSFMGEEIGIDARSIVSAEELAKNLITRIRPNNHVTYIVRNWAGETRYGTVRAKHI